MSKEKLVDQLLGRRVRLMSLNWDQTLVGILIWADKEYFILRQDHDVLLAVSRNAVGAFSGAADPPQRNSQVQSH